MTAAKFKSALNAEIGREHIDNHIEKLEELTPYTHLLFAYPVSEKLLAWLNSRFQWGVTDQDNTKLILINTPAMGKTLA